MTSHNWLKTAYSCNDCRIFPMLLTTYDSMNGTIWHLNNSELVSVGKPLWQLSWSSQILLDIPVFRLKSYGDCTFRVIAPHPTLCGTSYRWRPEWLHLVYSLNLLLKDLNLIYDLCHVNSCVDIIEHLCYFCYLLSVKSQKRPKCILCFASLTRISFAGDILRVVLT